MKKEFHIFLTTVMFFTRIPGPKWVHHNADYVKQSVKYFPLIGSIIGAIGALIFLGSSYLFSKEIAILLSMCSTIYATGALHEDGFADVCDGFGGGWTKDSILQIMKDSRLGTYGTLGVFFILGLKFAALYHLETTAIPLVLIAGHSSSRFIAATLLYTHPYVRDANDSKAKPATTSIGLPLLLISACFGILPLLGFGTPWVFLALLPMYGAKLFLGAKFKKWIGGQTGDCAGAVQQLSELIFYLTLNTLWTYI